LHLPRQDLGNYGSIIGTSLDYYDSGKIRSECNFVNGQRNGEWKLYGYSGEIIQSGNYIDSKELNIKELENIKCDRIEVNLWNESEAINYIDIFIINPYDSLRISYKDSLKKLVSKEHSGIVSIEEIRW
jgi:hypothetical protein